MSSQTASSNSTCIIADILPDGFNPPQTFNVTAFSGVISAINQSCRRVLLNTTLGIIVGIDDLRNLTTGTGNSDHFSDWFSPWSSYDFKVILSRFIAYKLPLLVLILQLPRAPLGHFFETFTVLHLIGNPVDSVASFLHTLSLSSAVLRAVRDEYTNQQEEQRQQEKQGQHEAQNTQPEPETSSQPPEPVKKRCRELSLVLIAYASIGKSPRSPSLPDSSVKDEIPPPVTDKGVIQELVKAQRAKPEVFEKAARSLAADRRVNKIPVLAALVGFVAAVAFGYADIDLDKYDEGNPQAIAIWSLSSSMTVNWPIVAEFLAWIIGAPKSANSTRRILHQLEEDLKLGKRRDLRASLETQISSGAMPNYRPDRHRRRSTEQAHPDKESGPRSQVSTGDEVKILPWWVLDISAFLIVSTGPLGGIWLASVVPPDGANCRTINKVVMWGLYLVGWILQMILNWSPIENKSLKLGLTAAIDLAVLIPFTYIIAITQAGLFNRLGCYAQQVGKIWGVFLPQFSWGIVHERLGRYYPGILFGDFLLQFLICVVIFKFYLFREARKVLRQGDKEPEGVGISNDGTGVARETSNIESSRKGAELATQVTQQHPMVTGQARDPNLPEIIQDPESGVTRNGDVENEKMVAEVTVNSVVTTPSPESGPTSGREYLA